MFCDDVYVRVIRTPYETDRLNRFVRCSYGIRAVNMYCNTRDLCNGFLFLFLVSNNNQSNAMSKLCGKTRAHVETDLDRQPRGYYLNATGSILTTLNTRSSRGRGTGCRTTPCVISPGYSRVRPTANVCKRFFFRFEVFSPP